MSGMPGTKKCDSCGDTHRVLSLTVEIRYAGMRTRVPASHICEGCILAAPDLAKLALELQGGEPGLAEQFSENGPRPRNRTLFVLSDTIRAVYCRWRGVAA